MSAPHDAGNSHAISVRWSDSDALGHVNNAVIVTYIEEARDLIIGPLLDSSMTYVVARIEVDYRAELRSDQRMAYVAVEVESVGNASLTCRERVTDAGGVLIAEARSTIVQWNPATRHTAPFSENARRALTAARPALPPA